MKEYSSVRGFDLYPDINPGVHQSDTVYGAPSYEPYPDMKFEKEYSYTGGRDKNRSTMFAFLSNWSSQAVSWQGPGRV